MSSLQTLGTSILYNHTFKSCTFCQLYLFNINTYFDRAQMLCFEIIKLFSYNQSNAKYDCDN